jgi:hypothetical protein
LLHIVKEETKNQRQSNIKLGAAEIGQGVADSIQLSEDNALAEFDAISNETPEPQRVSSYLIS